MKEMPVSYHRILDRLEREEGRLLNRKPLLSLDAQKAELEQKIPPAVRNTLEGAFQKAFSALFGPGGTWLVERTYAKQKLEEGHRVWEKNLSPGEARRELRRIERQGMASRGLERCAAGAEGTVLGLLGVGLPDIPVFLGVLLRSLYQSAARYGFSYESAEERVYLLLLLRGALSEGEERRGYSRRADDLGRALDHSWPTSCRLEAEVAETAKVLADRLLLVKFVQGLPVVGAVGGAANMSLSGRVSRFGALKYKKRFLERKVRGL